MACYSLIEEVFKNSLNSGMDSERNFGLNDGQNWKTCSRSGDGGCRGRFCFPLVCTYLFFLNSTVASVFQLVFQPLFVINWTFTCLEVSVNCGQTETETCNSASATDFSSNDLYFQCLYNIHSIYTTQINCQILTCQVQVHFQVHLFTL